MPTSRITMPTKPPTDVQLFSKTVIWSVPSLSFCQMILHQSEESFQQRFIFCSSEKLCYLYLLLFACAIGTFPKGQLHEGWNPPLGAASVVQFSPVLCPCHSTQMRHCGPSPQRLWKGGPTRSIYSLLICCLWNAEALCPITTAEKYSSCPWLRWSTCFKSYNGTVPAPGSPRVLHGAKSY